MKNLVFLIVAAACVVTAKADTLYWMVSEAAEAEFNYAQLYYTTSGTSASGGTEVSDGGTYQGASGTYVTSTPEMEATLDSVDGITGFYVGWAKYDGSLGEYTFSRWVALDDALHAMDTSSNGGQTVSSHTGTLAFVPEPTSGPLMMLGCLLLALKRRCRV